MSDRYKKPIEVFQEWKALILAEVHNQLDNCKGKPFSYNVTLSDNKVQYGLKALHDKYVLVPTDKAANNITIVCKKYYISLIQMS